MLSASVPECKSQFSWGDYEHVNVITIIATVQSGLLCEGWSNEPESSMINIESLDAKSSRCASLGISFPEPCSRKRPVTLSYKDRSRLFVTIHDP